MDLEKQYSWQIAFNIFVWLEIVSDLMIGVISVRLPAGYLISRLPVNRLNGLLNAPVRCKV